MGHDRAHDRPEAAARRFVEMPLDKHAWSPSPLLGQVVLVTTVDSAGLVNAAPKSWVSMVSFTGPRLGFGCNVEHRTHHNIEATGEFVINVPNSTLADAVWGMVSATDRLDEAGLTLAPSRTVAVPYLEQCPAYLECRHERTVELGNGEVFVLGTITAVAIDEACRAATDVGSRYTVLDPFFFLEDGRYAAAGQAREILARSV